MHDYSLLYRNCSALARAYCAEAFTLADLAQSVRLAVNGVARAIGKLGDIEGVHRAVDDAYGLMARNDVPPGLPSSISYQCYSAAQTASNAATAYVTG